MRRFDRFELVRRLGGGAVAEVWLVRDGARLAVLKRLQPHLADDRAALEGFLREVSVAARLRHPHLARVLELGETHGRPWFLSEYVDGRTVRELGGVSIGAAARLIADAALGLHALHSATDASGRRLDVVHGDVSPANLLLGRDGLVRVIDFGLARVRARGQDDSLGGTWEYMAPEQALDGVADARADQFSLGVVAWEAFTGRRLFAADADSATLAQVVECQVTPPTTLRPSLPPELEQVTLRMLERDPAARYPSCEEVARALDGWLRAAAIDGRELLREIREPSPAPRPVPSAPRPGVAPAAPGPVTNELTAAERALLEKMAAMQGALTVERLEAELDLPNLLDLAQALVEHGHLRLERDGRLTIVSGLDGG